MLEPRATGGLHAAPVDTAEADERVSRLGERFRGEAEAAFTRSRSRLHPHRRETAYYLGKGVPLDSAKSVALLERACAGHNHGSCLIAGLRYERGMGAPQDVAKAFALYNQDCEAGRHDACKQAERLRKSGNVDVK